jgi:hypothetical protein
VVVKLATGQSFLRVLWFSHVSIIPFILHTHFHLHADLTRRTKGEAWELSKKEFFLEMSGGALGRKVDSLGLYTVDSG